MSKRALSVEDLESQVALELPDREMMLVTVVITNNSLLNNNTVEIDVKNNNVALQICFVVQALNNILVDENNNPVAVLVCDIEQNQGGNGGNGGNG